MSINFKKKLETLPTMYTEQFYYKIEIEKNNDHFGENYIVETFGDGPRDLLMNRESNQFFNEVFGVEFNNIFYLDTGVDVNCDVELLLTYKVGKNKNIVIFVSGTSGEYNDENYDANVNFTIYENLSDDKLLKLKDECIYRSLRYITHEFNSKLKELRDFASNDQMILVAMKEYESLNEIINLNFNNNLKEELSEEVKTKKKKNIRKM